MHLLDALISACMPEGKNHFEVANFDFHRQKTYLLYLVPDRPLIHQEAQLTKPAMKYHWRALFFTLSLAGLSYAQDSAVIVHIDSIPPQGILLDRGWKFHAGDDTAWAKPEYDERTWQTINPALDIHDSLPQIPKSGGICWFRLHLWTDSSIKRQLALVIYQSGASEIFLNGIRIAELGLLSSDPTVIKAYDPDGKPVLLPSNNGCAQVIAVRYALQPGISYTSFSGDGNPGLRVRLNTRENSMEQYYQQYSSGLSVLEIFRGGVFFILAILHLAFYLFYPSQKANLYFFMFALFMCASQIIGVRMIVHDVANKFYYFNLGPDLLTFSYVFMLTALYILLAKTRGWYFWSLTALIIIAIFLNVCTYGLGRLITIVFVPWLISLEIARIAYQSTRSKKRGGWILLGGAIGFLVFSLAYMIAVVLGIYTVVIFSNFTILYLGFNFANLSIPVATSIYLGLDFAFTNRSLTQKLSEVEILSRKSILQEQEKQQILATQNETLERQVQERTTALSNSLKDLSETQAQLIQSEKMASLGELTAGIAHEIQNPLNFINNFSEVNTELVEEAELELKNGNPGGVENALKMIKANQDKITQHGKRADGIVKGMLLHSRTGAGEKILADINALVDECLKLSYHNMRAKDKSFDVQIFTDFDQSIGKFQFVPQDMVRVLVNLLNNAFYAVAERKKIESDGYIPCVSVATTKEVDLVTITVKDNGSGIPQRIIDKIFQPFFTTKPAGQGTGLGLSLSYDIIKAHGGEIEVDSTEGEGSKFIIQLSSNNA